MRPKGMASTTPKGAIRPIATFRCASGIPAARARSLASPAVAATPNPAAPVKARPPATGAEIGAAAARRAGVAKPAIEPRPDASLYVIESGSPPSGRTPLAKSWIFLRAASSSSSSRSVAAPNAASSPVPTAPAPKPAPMFSKNPGLLYLKSEVPFKDSKYLRRISSELVPSDRCAPLACLSAASST